MGPGDADLIDPVHPFTPRSNYFGQRGADTVDGLTAVEGARGLGSGIAGAADSGVWRLAPGRRGEVIEQMLGQNLPQNFPLIDRFAGGVATSVKSLDLNASTYQSQAALSRTVTGYVDKLAGFNGTSASGWAGVRINPSQINTRVLDLAVPGRGSSMQQSVLQGAVRYGESVGVRVNVIVIH